MSEPREWDAEGDLTGFFQPAQPETAQTAPQAQPAFAGINPGYQPQVPGVAASPQFVQPQHQQPPLPDIVIPEGYALAGRYQSLQDLERHAAHFQSLADRTRNEAAEAMSVKAVLDANPALYDMLTEALERGQASGVPDVVKQAIVTDDMGNQKVDPERLAAGVQAMVDQRVQPLQQQVSQQLTGMGLAQQYQQMGLTQQDLQADLAYAQQLGQLPEDQMLLLARQIRLGQATGPQPAQQAQPAYQPAPVQAPPAIPRTVTSLGGYRQTPPNAQDQGAQIAQTGRRSFSQLFGQDTRR